MITARTKLIYVDTALQKYRSIFIHLDGRSPGVLLPAHLRLRACVNLQIGRNMPVPIPDLRVDETGIYGTLSFSSTPFTCFIPWNAVYTMVTDQEEEFPFSPPPTLAYVEAGMIPNVQSIFSALDKRNSNKEKTRQFQKKSSDPILRPSYLKVVK